MFEEKDLEPIPINVNGNIVLKMTFNPKTFFIVGVAYKNPAESYVFRIFEEQLRAILEDVDKIKGLGVFEHMPSQGIQVWYSRLEFDEDGNVKGPLDKMK